MHTFKADQDLDQYIAMFENIYEPIQNVEREFNQILARMVESLSACSQFINKANEKGLADNLPKIFSWYCSLVTKSQINNSLSDVVWKKYPRVCPYCLSAPCKCMIQKKSLNDNRYQIEQRAKDTNNKPLSLNDWQTMFSEIYPRDPQGFDQKSNFTHLVEELGEASEAYRFRYFVPISLENELADVLSWIIGMANLLDSRARDGSLYSYSRYRLAEQVFLQYPAKCLRCNSSPCKCPYDKKWRTMEVMPIAPEALALLIKEISEELKLTITQELQKLLLEPDAQRFLSNFKMLSINNTDLNDKDLLQKFIEEPQHLKWYKKITAEGLAESGIITILSALAAKAFG